MTSPTPAARPDAAAAPAETVAIVGSGFSGLCVAIQLKQAGIDSFTIYEKNQGIGGTWRDNTYPGAACDVESHLYSFSFAPNPSWTHKYSPQQEILEYLERIVDQYDLRRHLRFGVEVTGAELDEASGTWSLSSKDGPLTTAQVLVLGNGALCIPSFPSLPGVERFAGPRFHSARWDHDYALEGKTVAVVGTGASAIQFVPEIAPRVKQLHLFQRTPPWILPKPDRRFRALEHVLFRALPRWRWAYRASIYWRNEARAVGFVVEPRVLKFAQREGLRHLAAAVSDPELRKKLTPDYTMGCKRILISNDYYQALTRPNVELVTDAIAEVERDAVRTADGTRRPVDAIIFGTGFTPTEYLAPMRVVGRGGAELNQTWQREPEAYLGIAVAGFPNLFLMTGPNTGLGHTSMVFMIEAQARYIRQCVEALRRDRLATMEVRKEVQDRFNAELQRKLEGTVWMSGCRSWYQGPSGKSPILWPTFTVNYWWRTRKLTLDDYRLERAGATRAVLMRSVAA